MEFITRDASNDSVDNMLRVYPQKIDPFLSPKALVLANKEIKNTIHQLENGSIVVECRFAVAIVPVVDKIVPEFYLRKWGNLLNDLAERGVWQFGTLSKCIVVPMSKATSLEEFLKPPNYEASKAGLLLSYIFTGLRDSDQKQDTVQELNEKIGYEVFQIEGGTPKTFDWQTFPW